MSKKKFSEGLDDLFRDQSGGEGFWAQTAVEAPARERKAAHKNFMHDLDVLLQEALEESLDKQGQDDDLPSASTPRTKSKTTAGAYRAPMSGLDALIRQTIDVQEILTDEATGKKRLTVAVDKTKLEKLKAIARLENSYMKDILVQLIDEYIREYTKDKGIDF